MNINFLFLQTRKNLRIFISAAVLILLSGALNNNYAQINEEWVAFYNAEFNNVIYTGPYPFNNAIDIDGNTYVTGYDDSDGTGFDCVLIKYNSDGEEVWVRKFNGPGNGRDLPSDIKIDDDGNVYITGSSYMSSEFWDIDIFTIKYSPSGDVVWVSYFNGPGDYSDYGLALVLDDLGNVFITGITYDADRNIATIKYNSLGEVQWVSYYSGVAQSPNISEDTPYDIALDSDGNVVVTGESSLTAFVYDYVTVKYNGETGAAIWVTRYDGLYGSDVARAVVTDESNDVYVTGYSLRKNVNFEYDYVTIKYNGSTGQQVWLKAYDGPYGGWDSPTDMIIDGDGNMVVTGVSKGDGDFNWDMATIKYSPDGDELWISRYNTEWSSSEDLVNDLEIDNENNIYVTGKRDTETNGEIFTTIKYNTNGEQQWIIDYDGNYTFQEATALSVDGDGNLYVTGYVIGHFTNHDQSIVTIKYRQVIVVPEAIEEAIETVQELPLTEGNKNALISKLQNALSNYNEGKLIPARNQLYAFLNQLNQFVLDGKITALEAQPLIDYVNQIIAAINASLPKVTNDESNGTVSEFGLAQNYPNPFNPITTISYSIPNSSFVQLVVYNSIGQEIANLVNETIAAGNHTVEFDASNLPSGIYYYRIQTDNLVETKKMILLK